MSGATQGVEAWPGAASPGDDHRVQKIKECFRAWDIDGSGYITKCELTRVIHRLLGGPAGLEVSHVDIEQLMREADKDGNGKIEYEEFLDWLTRPGARISHTSRGVELFDLADVLRPLFEVYDQNGDGTISEAEFEECHLILQNALHLAPARGRQAAKPGMIARQADHVFNTADRDSNHVMSFDEFVDWQRRALKNDGLSNDDLAELLPALARQLGRVFKVSQAQQCGILRDQKADERVLKRIIQNLANFTRDLWNEDKLASNSVQGKHHYVNRWTEPPVGLNINRLKAKHLMLQGMKIHRNVDFAGFRVFCVPALAVPAVGQRRWLGKVIPASAVRAGWDAKGDASYYVYDDLLWSMAPEVESEFEDAVEKLAPELRIFCLLKLEANFGLKIRWEEILAGLQAAVELGYMTADQLKRYVEYMQKIVVKQARAKDDDDTQSDDDTDDDASGGDDARRRRAACDDAEVARELLAKLVVPPRTVMATLLDHGILNTSSALADFLADARSL